MRSYKLKPKAILKKVFFVFIIVSILSIFSPLCSAQLADEYAPIFYFEGGENCYPVSVSYLSDLIDISNPSSKTISGEVVNYYDNSMGTVKDNGVIDDYKNKQSQYGYTVYYYVGTSGTSTFIQYWMFYAFNDGEHNRHEGDWEMVEVVIPSGGEKWVAYSQHYSGQRATWDQVEKDGNNIKVYVARGSHANYLRSYSGKVGIASDIVGANGKILKPSDYSLVELNTQSWLNQDIFWGEINDANDFISGSAGPQGPQYRQDMNGNLMWDGVSWGSGLVQADNTIFMLEWFLYNFVLIFVLIALATIALICFRIYRRYKKYGLGPRVVSMLYIDGINLKSIGNILCIVGIIIAIIGLFGQWYVVSADIDVEDVADNVMTDILVIDGLNGVQITMPGADGPSPMGTIAVPFYLILLIGFIFMILAAIGLTHSRKLGMKYLMRGIRLIVVIVIILVVIMSIGMMAGAGDEGSDSFVSDFLNEISSSPMGGQYSYTIQDDATAQIDAEWGLGSGAILILLSGVILMVAGILEIMDNKIFFETKQPIEKKGKKKDKNSDLQKDEKSDIEQ